jgi:hypothetical protein
MQLTMPNKKHHMTLKNPSKTTRKQAVGHPNIAGKQILTFTLASRMANIRSIPILTPTQGTWT